MYDETLGMLGTVLIAVGILLIIAPHVLKDTDAAAKPYSGGVAIAISTGAALHVWNILPAKHDSDIRLLYFVATFAGGMLLLLATGNYILP